MGESNTPQKVFLWTKEPVEVWKKVSKQCWLLSVFDVGRKKRCTEKLRHGVSLGDRNKNEHALLCVPQGQGGPTASVCWVAA
jgi:hypothetical protein